MEKVNVVGSVIKPSETSTRGWGFFGLGIGVNLCYFVGCFVGTPEIRILIIVNFPLLCYENGMFILLLFWSMVKICALGPDKTPLLVTIKSRTRNKEEGLKEDK